MIPKAGSILQGDLRLPDTDMARRLISSTIPARLAYVATGCTPARCPPGLNGPARDRSGYLPGGARFRYPPPAARVAARRANPTGALTIESETLPPKSATIRGGAGIEEIDGLAPECVSPAHCCLGDAAAAMLAGTDQPGTDQPGTNQPGTVRARIAVRPTWVGLLDFAERLTSTLGGVQQVAS